MLGVIACLRPCVLGGLARLRLTCLACLCAYVLSCLRGRVFNLLACLRAWCACLLTCLNSARAYVLTHLACLLVLCPYVLTCLTCLMSSNILRACVFTCFFDIVCSIFLRLKSWFQRFLYRKCSFYSERYLELTSTPMKKLFAKKVTAKSR